MKLFGEPSPKPGVDHEAENRRLKRELARVTEERDILKKATVYFATVDPGLTDQLGLPRIFLRTAA